jgi:hypothetical protein
LSPALALRRVGALTAGRPLTGSAAPWGEFELCARELLAHIPDDVWAAESMFRIAWHLLTGEQGGVLMHGCAFSWGGRGVAAIGQSTAGKSTLAALSVGHPGHATLLTDEIVQLFPDGTCWGTPFRSEAQHRGSPGPAKLKSLLILQKGDHEALTQVEPAQALPLLLGQVFSGGLDAVPKRETARRLMTLVDTVGVHRLTFRKDAAVGPFLRGWVGQ